MLCVGPPVSSRCSRAVTTAARVQPSGAEQLQPRAGFHPAGLSDGSHRPVLRKLRLTACCATWRGRFRLPTCRCTVAPRWGTCWGCYCPAPPLTEPRIADSNLWVVGWGMQSWLCAGVRTGVHPGAVLVWWSLRMLRWRAVPSKARMAADASRPAVFGVPCRAPDSYGSKAVQRSSYQGLQRSAAVSPLVWMGVWQGTPPQTARLGAASWALVLDTVAGAMTTKLCVQIDGMQLSEK